MKKRTFSMGVTVFIMLTLLACGTKTDKNTGGDEVCPVEDYDRTEREFIEKKKTWQGAYLEILHHLPKHLAPLYEPDGTNFRSDIDIYNPLDMQIYLGLHDFDEDGILELIVGDTISMAVFTYKDGRAEKIADLYYPDIEWCINGVYFKDDSISINCDGSGGSDFVNFGYLDDEYVLGLYSECNPDYGITVNGVESTFDEVDRIYTLNWEERSEGERKERLNMVWENEKWVLKYPSGEEVVLDCDFDFNSILW